MTKRVEIKITDEDGTVITKQGEHLVEFASSILSSLTWVPDPMPEVESKKPPLRTEETEKVSQYTCEQLKQIAIKNCVTLTTVSNCSGILKHSHLTEAVCKLANYGVDPLEVALFIRDKFVERIQYGYDTSVTRTFE